MRGKLLNKNHHSKLDRFLGFGWDELYWLKFNPWECKMSYSKLYIDTDASLKEVNQFIDGYLIQRMRSSSERQFSILMSPAYRNEAFNADIPIGSKPDPTETTYYVEVSDLDDENDDTEAFKQDLADLVVELRSKFGYVVASCLFEDFIAERTGWN